MIFFFLLITTKLHKWENFKYNSEKESLDDLFKQPHSANEWTFWGHLHLKNENDSVNTWQIGSAVPKILLQVDDFFFSFYGFFHHVVNAAAHMVREMSRLFFFFFPGQIL